MPDQPKRGRPRLGRRLKTPDDYGDSLRLRVPKGHKRICNSMKALAKREKKTVGEVWIEAAILRLEWVLPEKKT